MHGMKALQFATNNAVLNAEECQRAPTKVDVHFIYMAFALYYTFITRVGVSNIAVVLVLLICAALILPPSQYVAYQLSAHAAPFNRSSLESEVCSL